jgi:hypothetical protein
MATFAELDNNIVVRIIAVNDVELLDENNIEQESIGINFCQNLLGGGPWVQTFMDGRRKQFGDVGYTYDCENDVFISPQPNPSSILDEHFDWFTP